MTVFSAVDAAFEGFRVTWEKPKTLLIWTGFFLLVDLLIALVIFGFGLTSQMAQLDAVSSGGALDAAAELELMRSLWPLYVLFIVAGLLVYSVIAGGVFRLVLDPENSRIHPLHLGMEEIRLIGLLLIHTLLLMIIVSAVVVIGGVYTAIMWSVIGAVGLNFLAPILGMLSAIVMIFSILYIIIRMSLGPVISFSEKRLSIFDSWNMTKALFFPMLGSYVLAIISFLIFYILSVIIMVCIAAILVGGDLVALRESIDTDFTSFRTYFSPIRVLVMVFGAFTLAVFYAVMSAPSAVIYREIRARRAAA
ncbi:MAG: hypothetical protein IM671_12800 [Phenylobacterium sp.]|nr:hypothetical protein [Phenylobacterium sp.]MCA4917317.1 hypothetical protein [Phenylobacterium sp.]MCA6247585.1 hypothetical protein [Phenylobacterium sp.]